MPTLHWIGKEKVQTHHNDVPYRVLKQQYTYGNAGNAVVGVDTDSPSSEGGVGEVNNMIIHGDNLEALKALLPEYENRVDCIYIDPPYNTGNEGWVYNDNVNDPHIRKWLGAVVGKEAEDLTRHDKWLCMMYPRLVLLQKLLSPTGAIFISIDDNEQANLKLICDEIFGAGNFVVQFIWHNNKKGRQMDKYIKTSCEYVLVYAQHKLSLSINDKEVTVSTNLYPYADAISAYKKGYPLHNGTAAFHIGNRPNLCYSIYYNPQTNDIVPIDEKIKIDEEWQMPISVEGIRLLDLGYKRIIPKENSKYNKQRVWRWSKEKVLRESSELMFIEEENTWYIYQKERISLEGTKVVKYTNYIDIDTSRGRDTLNSIFNNQIVFEFPKPVEYISQILQLATHKDALILDSFAGSGTTAHAVLNLNKQDGGHRRFILVEMCDYAETITAERVRRVIDGYGEGSKAVEGTGGSFAFYELGDTIYDPQTGLLNDHADTEQIRRYIWYSETNMPYHSPKGCGDDASRVVSTHPTPHPYLLGRKDGTNYYFYYKRGEETVLDRAFLNTFTPADQAEQYIIYADCCRLSRDFMLTHHITFKQIPRDIKKV